MRILIILSIVVLSRTAVAQETFEFTGHVVDSLQAPIELANVVAIENASGAVASFAVSDAEGFFLLKLQRDQSYNIKASFVGYETVEVPLEDPGKTQLPFKIELRSSTTQLEDLHFVEEMPITISGDTITYSADAFTKGNERKLEDVLEALPGFDVDKNGEIKVQGKKVERVLVEGKEFFEGDTKLAAENIPADAVDKVQVFTNFNDIAPLGQLNADNDRIALNIQLQEDKKNFVFGDVEGGLGPDQRYATHANLFYYNPKTTFNLIAAGNNVGKEVFSPSDYFRFQGGMAHPSGEAGSSLRISEENAGFGSLQNNMAKAIDTKVGAFNFNRVSGNGWKFSGFLIGSHNDQQLASLSNRRYVTSGRQNEEQSAVEGQRINQALLTKLKTTYAPNKKLYVNYELFAKYADQSNESNMLTNNLGTGNRIQSDIAQQPINVTQKLSTFLTAGDKNILSLDLSHEYQRQNPLQLINSEQRLFSGLLPLQGEGNIEFWQDKAITTQHQESAINWYRILNKTNHLNFKMGNVYTYQQMTSSINQDGNEELNQPDYANDATFSFSDLYVGLNYRTKIGKFTFDPGLNLHWYRTQDQQWSDAQEGKHVVLLPELSFKYKILSSQSIRARYALQTEFMDIQQLGQGVVVQNYNNLFGGNRQLTNALYHSLTFNYFNFSMFNQLNVFGAFNYQWKYDDFSQALYYNGLERYAQAMNVQPINQTGTVYGEVEKTFKRFKLDGQLSLMYASLANQVDDLPNTNTSVQQQYEVSAQTTFFNKLHLTVGLEYLNNRYQSERTSNRFTNTKPFGELEFSFLRYFTLAMDYEYHVYRSASSSASSQYDFLNAKCFIQKPDSPFTLILSGTNLTNTQGLRRDSFTDSLESTYAYFVQPRYLVVTLKYDF